METTILFLFVVEVPEIRGLLNIRDADCGPWRLRFQ